MPRQPKKTEETKPKTVVAPDRHEVEPNTIPLVPQMKERNGKNGKNPKVMKVRALLFTDQPYGFRETWIEESKVLAAGITPVNHNNGDIYLVVCKHNNDGSEVISRWPSGIEFPVVTSGKLGRAIKWDMIPIIAKSGQKGWSFPSMSPWVIVVIVLVLIFFIGFFGLFGGS